jgi:hypothetical protein
MKKILLGLGILALIGAIAFYWWNNQSNVKDLNENLPEGVRIEKDLVGFGNGYKIVNKIDGYEFKTPKEWDKYELNVLYQNLDKEIFGFSGSAINLKDKEIENNNLTINSFLIEDSTENLKTKTEKIIYKSLGIEETLTPIEKIGVEILKINILGNYMYFFEQQDRIYGIISPSENIIEEIITNGNW